MKSNITRITIESNNPDYQNSWFRKYVEEEMKEVGCIADVDWTTWVFEHVFCDEADFTNEVLEWIVEHNVTRIELQFKSGNYADIQLCRKV